MRDARSRKRLARDKRHLFELLVGYACNCNCSFCSIDPSKRGIQASTAFLLGSIRRAKKEGFRYLGIGGGEPTIREDLPELIKLGKTLGFDAIRIETNGIMLAYPDYCKRLSDAGLDFVKISIHGHTPRIHDSLTNVPGSFSHVLKAIDNLRNLKVRVEINTVINRINYKSYPDFVDFFVQKGVGSFCFIYPLFTGRMMENSKAMGVRMEEAAPYLKSALDLAKKFELDKAIVFNIPPCHMRGYEENLVEFKPFNMQVVSPDNKVENADYDRIGLKDKAPKCRRCRYYSRCEGVWKEYLQVYKNARLSPVYEN